MAAYRGVKSYRWDPNTGAIAWEGTEADTFRQDIDKALAPERARRRWDIHGKHYGPYYEWQEYNAYHIIDMPARKKERFDAFIASQAVKPNAGLHHLHAFWNARAGKAYWKVVHRGSSICKAEGRCVKIRMEVL